jgi:microcystin-dependent protein
VSNPYVGEIRMFGGSFAPAGWEFCNGQLMPISENETLFQLIGTTYGGDGESTFGLPDLRGRLPLHQGNGSILGQNGGAEQIQLTTPQIAAHTHGFLASNATAAATFPTGSLPAATNTSKKVYAASGSPTTAMAPQAIGASGGNLPHDNFQPYLCVSFIISLFGVYPTPS